MAFMPILSNLDPMFSSNRWPNLKRREKKKAVRKVKRKLEKNVNSYSSHHVSATSSAETNRLESSNLFFFFFDPKKKIVCRLFKVCAYFSDLVAVQDLFSEETNSIAQD